MQCCCKVTDGFIFTLNWYAELGSFINNVPARDKVAFELGKDDFGVQSVSRYQVKMSSACKPIM